MAKKADTVTEEHVLNLSSIKFGIDAEIEKALTLFCKDELRLSKVYWPKAFRSLSIHVLESLLKKPEIGSELRTPSFDIDEEQLKKLIVELQFPSSHFIKVKQMDCSFTERDLCVSKEVWTRSSPSQFLWPINNGVAE